MLVGPVGVAAYQALQLQFWYVCLHVMGSNGLVDTVMMMSLPITVPLGSQLAD